MCEPRFIVISNAGQLTRFATFTEALATSKETSASGSGVLWLDNNQVPRIEEFPHNNFIIVNAFNCEGSRLTVDEMSRAEETIPSDLSNFNMNVTIRRLTIITTIFMPLTLLAGLGGMSEWSIMTGAENWRITYPAFLLAIVMIGVVNYILLKWLERWGQRLQSPRCLQQQAEAQVIHE